MLLSLVTHDINNPSNPNDPNNLDTLNYPKITTTSVSDPTMYISTGINPINPNNPGHRGSGGIGEYNNNNDNQQQVHLESSVGGSGLGICAWEIQARLTLPSPFMITL